MEIFLDVPAIAPGKVFLLSFQNETTTAIRSDGVWSVPWEWEEGANNTDTVMSAHRETLGGRRVCMPHPGCRWRASRMVKI